MVLNSVPKRVQSLPSSLNLFLSKYSLFMVIADMPSVDTGSQPRSLELGPGNRESEQFGLEELSWRVSSLFRFSWWSSCITRHSTPIFPHHSLSHHLCTLSKRPSFPSLLSCLFCLQWRCCFFNHRTHIHFRFALTQVLKTQRSKN